MRGKQRLLAAIAGAVLLTAGLSTSAQADPAPGFDFDPAKLQARMDDCLEHAVDDTFLLMGWRNISTGKPGSGVAARSST